MIRHLLKMVWRRKKANALVIVEIFFSFVVLFAVVTAAVSLVSRWRRPIGFDHQNVWVLDVDRLQVGVTGTQLEAPDPSAAQAAAAARNIDRIDRVLHELRNYPEVEAAAGDVTPPYGNSTWTSSYNPEGRNVDVTRDQVTDDFAKVMRLHVLQGRWFSPADAAQSITPIVIDSAAARALYGSANPIAKRVTDNEPGHHERRYDYRVIGVIEPFRKEGEVSPPESRMVFSRAFTGKFEDPTDINHILVRIRPGTPASFEAILASRLRRAVPDVTFRVRRMDAMRQLMLRVSILPLVALSTIAMFLIAMVALGLTGVLWQTVTRRMREIGVRRAVGASGAGVRAQVLGEVAILATLAVAVATALLLQLPLLGIFSVVRPTEFAWGLVAALAIIYGITLSCGAYPGWLASKIEPAEALRYE